MYHYDAKIALEELQEEALLPHPVKLRDMILRTQLGPQDAQLLAGEFLMGSDDANAEPDERPLRRVFVQAFYIDRFEVTNRRYKEFRKDHRYPAGEDDLPVTFVPRKPSKGGSWRGAIASWNTSTPCSMSASFSSASMTKPTSPWCGARHS